MARSSNNLFFCPNCAKIAYIKQLKYSSRIPLIKGISSGGAGGGEGKIEYRSFQDRRTRIEGQIEGMEIEKLEKYRIKGDRGETRLGQMRNQLELQLEALKQKDPQNFPEGRVYSIASGV